MSDTAMPEGTDFAAEDKADEEAADKAARQEKRQSRRERQRNRNRRRNARGYGLDTISDYFSDQGLDPSDYGDDIEAQIKEIMGGISKDDPNPKSYFSDAGEELYNELQTGARTRAQRELDRLFNPGYADTRISNSADDALIESILGEQRQSADQIIENMLKRGVVTDVGASAARKDLDQQAYTGRARLNEIGGGLLSEGRQSLADIIAKARQNAGNLALGTTFDPSAVTGQVDTAYNDWLANLTNEFRGAAPTDLFSTGSLAATAGQGQGAQNTKFSPNALAGVMDDDEEETPNVENIF